MAEKWTIPENYYEQVAERDVNSVLHFAGRKIVGAYTLVAFGKPEVIVTPEFDKAIHDASLTFGNVIAAPTHRDERDTFMLPQVLEDFGIYKSRPVAKSDLFQINPVFSSFIHAVGAFAVDRKNPDFEGIAHAQQEILSQRGNLTIYPEGRRIRRNTKYVGDLKKGIIHAAAPNSSTIVPIGIAGLSTEVEGTAPHVTKVSRDKRARFGFGPKLVFCMGDPLRFGPLPDAADKDRHSQAVNERLALLKIKMQEALDRAYEHRGSSLEHRY